jgi:two-component system chemotaxis response regulator CheY
MTILVVEDDSVSRLVLRQILERIGGIEIQECENGMEAWVYLENNPLPDLCILDINMPLLGGIEFLRKVREDERFKELPVYFCSEVRDRQTILDAALLQPVYYMLKPVSPELLRRQVMLFREKGRSALPGVVAPLDPTQTTRAEIVELRRELEPQVEALKSQIPGLLKKLDVNAAIYSLKQVLARLEQFAAENRQKLHSMKSDPDDLCLDMSGRKEPELSRREPRETPQASNGRGRMDGSR